jgi:hypothetical protein
VEVKSIVAPKWLEVITFATLMNISLTQLAFDFNNTLLSTPLALLRVVYRFSNFIYTNTAFLTANFVIFYPSAPPERNLLSKF